MSLQKNAEDAIAAELREIHDRIRNIEQIALNHGIENVELFGNTLIVQDDHWTGHDKGQWFHSSETC